MSDNVANSKLVKTAGYVAVSAALFLVIAKLYAWYITDSLAIFSSLMDSLLDVATSALNFLAILYAAKPADEDHSYGHTSIEDIAGVFQAAAIAGSGIYIVLEAASQIGRPEQLSNVGLGLGITVLSLVVTISLVIFQKYTIRKTRSQLVEADSMHYTGDILCGLATIFSLVMVKVCGLHYFDPLVAVIISMILLRVAFKIGQQSYHNLMDREMPEESRAEIIGIIEGNNRLSGYSKLRTRQSGSRIFIQFIAYFKPEETIASIHKVTDDLEDAINSKFPSADIHIHMEPEV